MTVLKAKIGSDWTSILSGYSSNVWVGPDPPANPNMEFWVDTDATLPAVPWTNITFAANFRNLASGAGFTTCQYRRVEDVVELRGSVERINSTSTGDDVFTTLPTNYYCPTRRSYFPVMRSDVNYLGRVRIVENGAMSFGGAPWNTVLAVGSFFVLDGIMFSVNAT